MGKSGIDPDTIPRAWHRVPHIHDRRRVQRVHRGVLENANRHSPFEWPGEEHPTQKDIFIQKYIPGEL